MNSTFQKERKQLLQTLAETNTRLQALNRATEGVLARDRIDPNRELKRQLARLSAE